VQQDAAGPVKQSCAPVPFSLSFPGAGKMLFIELMAMLLYSIAVDIQGGK
jgi:hypothetical protein